MKCVALRYDGNFAPQKFVLSDKVAEDLMDAFVFVKRHLAVSEPVDSMIFIRDEDELLPPFVPSPEQRFDRRTQYGVPGSEAWVDLSRVASVRVAPVSDSEE